MSFKSFDQLFLELQGKVQSEDESSSSFVAVGEGVHTAGKKVLEEAGEVWLAAEHESDENLSLEISQLLYRIQILMLIRGISLNDVYGKL